MNIPFISLSNLIKPIFLLLITILAYEDMSSQTNDSISEKNIHFQTGYFNNQSGISSISGFKSINAGIRWQLSKSKYQGIELTIKNGERNQIIIIDQFSGIATGGNSIYQEYSLNYFRQKVINPGKNLEYGYYLSPGLVYSNTVTDPNPNNYRVEENNLGLTFVFTPFVYYHFENISFLLDFNFSKISYTYSSIDSTNPNTNDSINQPTYDLEANIFSLNFFQLGVAFAL